MKKTLYKPQTDGVDTNVNVYANEACRDTFNGRCANTCTDNVCDGSGTPSMRNDVCTNTGCVNDRC